MSIAEKLQTIAENEQKVYEAGYQKGKAEGGDTEAAYNNGFEAGKLAERNDFWGELTNYGQPKDYYDRATGCFNKIWTNTNFNPTYNIVPTNANTMFQSCRVTNLEKRLKECGVTLDMSQCTNVYRCFNASNITVIPELDLRNCTNFFQTFYSSSIVTIRKLILGDTLVSRNWNDTFINTFVLENIEIEGTIFDSTTMPSTVLTKASITSIINALSSETTNTTLTLKQAAVNAAFETAEGAADGSTSEEWLALINTKSNWTIVL